MILVINSSNVETCHGMSLQINNQFSKPKKGSISTIINQFKGSVKRKCNKLNLSFSWQPRFYEHIIRNEKSYIKIKQYIQNSPIKWELDEYF